MYCNGCGAEISAGASFCQHCGRQLTSARLTTPALPLERPRQGRKIAGVCLGFARHLNIDPTLMRVLWVLASFLYLGGVIAYIAGWILMPEEPLVATMPLSHAMTTPPAVGQ